jgi:orotate phosphoribosyltransferase
MSEILDVLNQVGAIVAASHFVLTSGKHSDTYINKDALYPHTKETSLVGRMFAEQSRHLEMDVVAGPAMGGIILAQWTAYHLSQLKGREILGVYTEKSQDAQIFTRGYGALVAGKKVLVVEDLFTTGGSVMKLTDSIRSAGGEVAGVCVMINRNPGEVNSELFGAPCLALANLKIESYAPGECVLCQRGIPINVTLAHGKEYMRHQAELAGKGSSGRSR